MEEKRGYHPSIKFLHWAIVLIVAVEFLTFSFLPFLFNKPERYFLDLHMSFGIAVLPLAILMIFLRILMPAEKENLSGWGERLSKIMHYSLYALLIILPFSGWMSISSRGLSASIFGLFALPALYGSGSAIGKLFGSMHSFFAGVIGFLVLGHIAAALYHHFIAKDDVLKGMLPKMFFGNRKNF